MNIEDKLSKLRFNVDADAHIKIDFELCEKCADKPCLYICPVQNYTIQDGKLAFSWQGCIECGACNIACRCGAVKWDYPRGGFGVYLRYG
jgi:ferredoxin like protein